jgi:uncharacterized protein YbjT (DUF2867 family)
MNHLLFGATGLIGSNVAKLIPENDLLFTVTRKPLHLNRKNHFNYVSPLDLGSLSKIEISAEIDAVYCCLGTTIKVAGSPEKFYEVDHDFVMNVAKLAEKVKAKKLIIISALGANPKSPVFYNRVKGDMERDVLTVTPSIKQVVFLRPSLLLGDRSSLHQPTRFGEKIAIQLTPIFSSLFIGPMKKYKPVPATLIAKKMIDSAHDSSQQMRSIILENESLIS